ncbi:MAG TPA: methyltransferase domain-containing protein, partial [Actinomycetota bacterium]
MSGLGFDDAVSRHIDALYRTDDAARRRRAVLDAATPAPGERVLDVGCGPGFLAAELADAVGPAGRVVGIDTSEPMLALARRRCGDRPWTEVQSGDASRLALADGDVDLAVSVQVHEYVPDVDRGLAEMARVLRPGGRAVIVATDWPSIV